MSMRFGFIPLKAKLMKEAFNQAIIEYAPVFEQLGGEQITEEQLNNPLPILYFIATGGTEQMMLNILERRNQYVKNESVLLIAHPAYNSLAASLEILAKLQQEGINGQIFYLNGVNDEAGIDKIKTALKNIEIKIGLKQSRIGMIGKPSDWLVASSPDPAILQKTWGPEVIDIPMDEIIKTLEMISSDEINEILDSLVSNATEIREPSQNELQEAVRVYVALKKIVKKYNLNALTIKCFDLVTQIKNTGCFGLAQLSDDGIIAGCEGDLVSTTGLFWVYKLLNKIPWMANPSQLDEKNNSLWLAHCTVPRSITKNYCLRSHLESGLGVGIQGNIPKGPVTLIRIGGKNMDKLWIGEGEIIQSGNSENLCRTQVEVSLTNGNVQDLLINPLGNHIVLVNGHHGSYLKNWWVNNIKSDYSE